jgi:hypothetical protein
MVATATKPIRHAHSRRDGANSQPTRKASRPTNHYTDNAELAELIGSWRHARNRLADQKRVRLIELLSKIAGGVWDRYEFTSNREDFVQDLMFSFFSKALLTVHLDGNVFSYLTTCAVNFGNRSRSKAIEDRRAELAYGVDRVARHYSQFSEC